ncbi:MAG: exopolyphosphatase [Lachnospiraceae bacterium]|jgi:exopolyphosphatase/guanosine-5'-triphosphate,3'-diphosphate pyrophosphatase|nr:exopolyphosphatase [Lachnospiraceae bacterium]
MPVKTFAAIDVGSYVIAMKIFEVSQKHGMREIDHIRYGIDMGTETYATGKLGYERVEELCRILREYREIMKGYKVEEYQAYATSAIRESDNTVILLDQIKMRTGIEIEVLSNSAQRFLHYKAAAWMEVGFEAIIDQATAIVDIGGGSIQVSLFDQDTLVSTQNLRLGVLRLQEHLNHLDVLPSHYEEMIFEIVDAQMASYKKLFLRDKEVVNIIVVDDYISDIVRKRKDKGLGKGGIDKSVVEDFLKVFRTNHFSDLAQMLDIPTDNMKPLLISGVLLWNIIQTMGAQVIWTPGASLCDGIAYEYAEGNRIISPRHDFEQDIIACAQNISKRYRGSKRRGENLEMLATTIFDSIKKVHGLGKRERLMLRLAALLHDCGKYISMINSGECAYSIIMATEIIGLSHREREMVANVVKYAYREFEYYETLGCHQDIDQPSYLVIAKLTAILRVAAGLDRSHRQKCRELKAVLKDDQLMLTVDTTESITLEQGLFDLRTGFFEEVFSIRPVLRRKRAY